MANEAGTEEEGEEQAEAAPRPPRPKRMKAKHAHHGGAWKVAYADFITTMMALFLLLWLLAAADQSTRTAISMFFRDPGIFDNPQGQNMLPGSGAAPKTRPAPILEVSGSGGAGQRNTENSIDMEKMARTLHQQVARTASQRGTEKMLNMTVTKTGLQLQLSDSADRDLFVPGSAVLTREAEQILKSMGTIIAAMDGFSVSLAGHTDSKPPPNLKYNNRDLSADRAQRVMQVLVATGVPASRIREVAGYGDLYLLDPQNPLAPTNRRMVITLRNTKTEEKYQGIPSAQPPAGTVREPAGFKPVEGELEPGKVGAGTAGRGEAGGGTAGPGVGLGTAHPAGAAGTEKAGGQGTAGGAAGAVPGVEGAIGRETGGPAPSRPAATAPGAASAGVNGAGAAGTGANSAGAVGTGTRPAAAH